MYDFKSCPRCKGDMFVGKDAYGEYKECLQCGNYIDIGFKNLDNKVSKRKAKYDLVL